MKVITVDIENNFYPQSLKNVYDPPKNLFCIGNTDLLKTEDIVAVVGSREISDYGKRVIEKLVPDMVGEGMVVVSGMAFGVDAYTADVCIKCGGKTIAVLASGPDVVTPLANNYIYEKILSNDGLVMSENGLGYKPNKIDFLKRNRIVAGIAKAVIVIEGGERSGSVNTARLALEMGKEVGAVPGRIFDENSKATNWLIKNGAIMVEEVADILIL